MHRSVWRFEGDPDDLEQPYLPRAHRAFFDSACPASALFEKHGRVPTAREDYPVIRAYGARSRLDEGEADSSAPS